MQIIGMQPMMQSELIEPALVPARDSAWNTAKETGNLAQYQPLLTAFGPNTAPHHTQPSPSTVFDDKARAELGYSPRDLDTGLREMFAAP